MDYEKAYKAVLQTATQWIKDGCTEKEKICLECVFPELRESEDERIRTSLYKFFQGMLEGHEDCYKVGGFVKFEGIDVKSILAWLEKQKEYHIPWYDYQKSKEAGYTIVPNEEYEQLIKQKEQNPAWSEVELLFRGEKVTVKRPFYRDDKGRGYSTAELDEDAAWSALRAWCEKKGISLYDLYPKAEWSEEDERILKGIIGKIDHDQTYGVSKDEMLTFLKRL